MESETKHSDISLDLKGIESGRIEGYGSIFGNRDQGGDIVAPGAFADSIKERKPKMLFNHDPSRVIGVWDEVAEDAKGLRLAGRLLLNTTDGADTHEKLKSGALDGLSVGYRTVEAKPSRKGRVIAKADLWEVSVVTFPMNQEAVIDSVKRLASQEDVERILRASGLPWGACKKLAAGGWPALRADELTPVEAKQLSNQITKLRANLSI